MRPKAFHGRKQLSFSEKIANFAVYVYRHIHFMGQRYGGIPPAPPPDTRPRTADDLYRMGIALPDGRGSRRKSDTDAGLGPLGMGSPYPHVVHSLRVCLGSGSIMERKQENDTGHPNSYSGKGCRKRTAFAQAPSRGIMASTGRKLHHCGVFRARMCLRRFSPDTFPPR